MSTLGLANSPQYQSSATGSYNYGAANTGNSSQSIWEQLIGTSPGIIASASQLITSIKADPNKIAQYTGGFNIVPGSNNNMQGNRNNMTLWIIVGLLVLGAVMYFAFRGGK